MNPAAPQIGFDRFIHLDWAIAALRVRAGEVSIDTLMELLEASHTGPEAKKKTRTVLNRLWLEPRSELVDFADRGVQIYRDAPDKVLPALVWGIAIAAYPFFGKVAEIVGRLTALQGECTAAEVHRRMAEVYGEREGTRRMTNMILQSQASWGAIERFEMGKRIVRKKAIDLGGEQSAGWLVEACLRYAKSPLAITILDHNPVTYPFVLGGAISYDISKLRSI